MKSRNDKKPAVHPKLADFLKRLHAEQFQGLTGAKKSIGKLQGLSAADKEKALAAAKRKYGE